MLPDQVSNPGPLTYKSGALSIALSSPAAVLSAIGLNNFNQCYQCWKQPVVQWHNAPNFSIGPPENSILIYRVLAIQSAVWLNHKPTCKISISPE